MRLFKFISYIMLAVFTVAIGQFIYPGADAEARVAVEPGTIRIGLARELPEMEFAVQGNYVITNGYNGEVITYAETGQNYTVQRIDGDKNTVRLYQNGNQLGIYTGPIVVEKVDQEIAILNGVGALAKRTSGQGLACIDASGTVTQLSKNISGLTVLSARGYTTPQVSEQSQQLVILKSKGTVKRYRGNLDLRPDTKGITVINYLPLEEYLYGVVPSEMPRDWPHEALKAQAVVARTYALYSSGQYISQGFDILATQMNQVYHGYDHEAVQTNKAVDETRGQVLTHNGRLVLAAFHSSSGGYVGNCSEIWKESIPYLKAKEDPHDYNDKHYNWSVSKNTDELLKTFADKGLVFEQLLDIEELQRDETGSRLVKMLVVGRDGEGNIKREEISNADRVRTVLGLKSSLFDMQRNYDSEGALTGVTITGSGWGHGLGMSQYGAKGMSEKGYNYQDILQYYYTGAKIELNYGG